jgi:hypothetical protein
MLILKHVWLIDGQDSLHRVAFRTKLNHHTAGCAAYSESGLNNKGDEQHDVNMGCAGEGGKF